jgi:hypothetical protein
MEALFLMKAEDDVSTHSRTRESKSSLIEVRLVMNR